MINLNNLFQNLNNASQTQNSNSTQHAAGQANDARQSAQGSSISQGVAPSVETNISANGILAHRLVNQNIYQQLSISFSQTTGQEVNANKLDNKFALADVDLAASSKADNSLFDFQAVADSVLGFIGDSIAKASERGESNDVLAEMFAGARAGVAMGIEQAKESLNEVSALSEDIEQGIAKSHELISKGIDQLEEKYFPAQEDVANATASLASAPAAVSGATNPEAENSKNDLDDFISQGFDGLASSAQSVNAASYQSDMFASRDRSSELSITTADGDLVTISFNQLQSYQRSESYNRIDAYSTNQGDGRGGSASYYGQSEHSVQSQYASEMSFSLSIEGELDDEELEAIGALIAQVNSLQKEFFNGDIEKAYQQALEIGFDDSQIREFALELEQVETYVVQEQYAEIASYSESPSNSAVESLKPLLSYIQQLDQNLQQARQLFAENDDKIDELMTQVFAAEFGDSKEMLAQLNSFNSKFTE